MEEKTEKVKERASQICVVRISGKIKLKKEIVDTLQMLNLPNKNSCVLIPSTPSYTGMVKKVKDFVTWGDADQETITIIEEKMGEKKFVGFHPSRGGYGRKGTKMPHTLGGALGPRKDIKEFIKKMI